jgi:hypothetical protein
MKSKKFYFGLTALALLGVLAVSSWFLPRDAHAASPDPGAAFGAVQVAAAAETCFPATPLNAREGIEVYNNGPATIFCAPGTGVTTANGRPISPGGAWAIGLTWRPGSPAQRTKVCCRTTQLQVAPADTRWTEIR